MILAQNSFTYFDKFNKDQAITKEVIAPSLLKKEDVESVFNVINNLTHYSGEDARSLDTSSEDPLDAEYDRSNLISYLEESTKAN